MLAHRSDNGWRDGRVFEEGTHDELVARGGLYAELFMLQVEKQCRVAGLMRLTCKAITFIVLALTYWLECKC